MVDQAETHSATTTDGAPAVAAQWSEHNAPNGRKYYYNSVTGESTWERYAYSLRCRTFTDLSFHSTAQQNLPQQRKSMRLAPVAKLDTNHRVNPNRLHIYRVPCSVLLNFFQTLTFQSIIAYGGYPQPYGQPIPYAPAYAGPGYMYPYGQAYGNISERYLWIMY